MTTIAIVLLCIIALALWMRYKMIHAKPALSNIHIPIDYDVNGVWFPEDEPMSDEEFADHADMIFSFKPKATTI